RPYGLGPRAPMYVISPWSRGGWVNSQVFDHTSVIRFLEARFGVLEPNISPWRRAVCGDLTSAFDFKAPNGAAAPALPPTAETAARAAALPHSRPPTPAVPQAPVQATGVRPSRALPYSAEANVRFEDGKLLLDLAEFGRQAVVLHAYDLLDLERVPRRYTIGSGQTLTDAWALSGGAYDLYVLGPNGFHRRFRGVGEPGLTVSGGQDHLTHQFGPNLQNRGKRAVEVVVSPNAYARARPRWRHRLAAGDSHAGLWDPPWATGGWYDYSVTVAGDPRYVWRFAGRIEGGGHSISDPAMGGPAVMSWA
ncbi:MAG: phospholipase phosphocholine-specific, partial [Phenylobacterium sp.]|nr:phospholipase phosphocholine-specific [Phenylobacterium sp.]